ncbi:gliding motility-associated C-terminal domain-containing protein [Taibaiella chishuiensis]|uniref:Gliding motility-associated-like protein n=1 Tax=Taibaiella chishuiensis TaxID=1434707 RepID=A0A2P8CZK9_9BACT|nr:gliding motility-associated C-terminal domain-containing protein [Taibaiella chishuiensis]PSK90401.1 gliding motility-associated-like protein [Taibaiella chishuiensis]
MRSTFYISITKGILLLLGLLCFVHVSYGQYENVWVFGSKNAAVDFNSGTPQPFASQLGFGVNTFGEASASVCNPNGNLLFYTDGTRVLDRQHNLMPNGNNLVPNPNSALTGFTPTSSTAQGAVIVPMPGSNSRYYIFSLTSFEHDTVNHFGKLYYSIVDMNLNSGFGDVVTGQKAIPFDSVLTERMTAVPGSCKNVWLLTVAQNMTVKAYEITAAGLSTTPVISPVTTLANLSSFNTPAIAGAIVGSPDHNKIAITREEETVFSLTYAGLALFDFNRATGVLSNERQLNPAGAGYGVCFSPDNTKLYFAQYGAGIQQFDLSAGTLTGIINSKTYVMPGSGHLKLAPDGKIYCGGSVFSTSLFATTALSAIQQPNQAGLACMPAANTLALLAGTGMRIGLPNAIAVAGIDTFFDSRKLRECGTAFRLAATDTTGTGYTWNDGFTTPARNVASSGRYWVRYQTPCNARVDTIEIQLLPPAQSGFTKVICRNDYVEFKGKRISDPGLYRDTFIAANGCDSIVTLDLVTLPAQDLEQDLQPDAPLCIGDTLRVEGRGARRYQWYTNGLYGGAEALQKLYLPRLSNEIMLVGTSENDCRDTVKTIVAASACCEIFVPNAFSPNGDGLNDGFGPESTGNFYNYHLFIYNRWGEKVFQCFKATDKWDGTQNGNPMETGTYFYQIKASCLEGSAISRKGDITLIR